MPLNNDFADQNCSVARTLEVIGERWSMLVIRDVFLGIRRFDEIQRHLGISRNVLTARLAHLLDLGVLKKVLYSERPERYEYKLTARGRDLWPVLMAMMQFGDEHAPAPDGPPRVFSHKDCGGDIDKLHLRCEVCGQDVGPFDVVGAVGPGHGGPKGEFGPLEPANAGA
ncbi:MAG: helix-turn-helix domain-containing protein [Solirubrobacteraceae bacterium]|nr:helix-turn-helix domain-containing protein [Patulibacter sp.]